MILNKAYLGSTEIKKAYLGSTLVFNNTYLLDSYTGSVGAYSLRKLKSDALYGVELRNEAAETANVILPESGSITMNSLLDIGGTLGDWAGSDTVKVRTWYDQSGNGNHAVQTAGNNRPRLINAGALETLNGNSAIYFDGVNDILLSNTFTASSQPVTRIGVSNYTSISDGRYFIDGSASNRGVVGTSAGSGGATEWRLYAGSIDDYATSPTIGNQYSQFAIFNGASSNLSINGINLGNRNVGTDGLDKVTIGGSGSTNTSQMYEGLAQEIIVYPSDQSSNRTAIETDINNHYSIY